MDASAPEPMKDVATCDKPGGAGSGRGSLDVRMGNPAGGNAGHRALRGGTWGTETSQYPEERKEKSTP